MEYTQLGQKKYTSLDGTNFGVVDNMDGTFRIECRFMVYYSIFKRYPTWMNIHPTAKDLHEGVSTKFWFLVEDDLAKEDADRKVKEYHEKYDVLINTNENNPSRWDEFPFQDKPIVYSK